jgi:uncharacterized membrane protein YhiD involved in acid resistance
VLVCLAAMLFVRLGLALIGDATARFPSGALRADPTRTIEALAVEFSFIGAGAIFRDRSGAGMLGLTTAAGLLAAATIGVAIAINRYIVPCGITVVGLVVLRVFVHLEHRLKIKMTDSRKRLARTPPLGFVNVPISNTPKPEEKIRQARIILAFVGHFA